MPSKIPLVLEPNTASLQTLGDALRRRRKAMAVNAVTAAQAAGLSRVTLHRIEKGESSVTMGAWINLASALGLNLAWQLGASQPTTPEGSLPTQIRLADYPQLQALAWQVHTDHLSPLEAYDVYERNQKHFDADAMIPAERQLWQALQTLAADVYRMKQAPLARQGKDVH